MSRLRLTFVVLWLIPTYVLGAVIGEPKRPYHDREDDRTR